MTPVPDIGTAEWAEKYFGLPEETSDVGGQFSMWYVPHLYGIFGAMDDPEVKEVVCMKAAQVAWTTAILVYILKRIHVSPCQIVVMFTAVDAAREFNDEKLIPTINATPAVKAKVDTSSSRRSGSRTLFKKFVGGFLKLIGSNSIRSVKSTPARVVIVEEPDDSAANLKEQGNSIRLLWERTKRMRKSKRILGGTPSTKGLSRVGRHLNASDKRVLPIVCHECGHAEPLSFDNVSWLSKEEGEPHEVYGMALPETAVYGCPGCGIAWSDYQRKENIRNTVLNARAAGDTKYSGWVATKEFSGAAGFCQLGELYSCLPGEGMASLVCDWLQALHSQSLGDDSDMIVFINSKRGEEYEYGEVKRDPDSLSKYAKDYEELVCPADGLMVTIGVDVQHDRLAIVVRAWGRDGKSWLIYFTEIAARVSCKDSKDPVWSGLDTIVFQAFEHECGAAIYASAISIDSSDGMTAEAVYEWVRTRKADRSKRRFDIMAIKGSSDTADDRPIYSAVKPKPIDHKKNSKLTKADKFGVTVHMVGTTRAKDLIDGQLELLQKGRGRFFYYSSVRSDYFAQLCAEVKAPHRSVKNRLVWQQKPGHPCEAWDCEVYALHAAYHCRVHLLKPAEWDRLENKLKQEDLFSAPSDADGAAKGDAEGGASSSSPAGQSGGWLGNSSGENWL